MILIVDSGSTKTDWISLDKNGDELFSTQTLGLNPQMLSNEILNERIKNNFDIYKRLLKLDSLNSWYFKDLEKDKDFDNLPNVLIHGKEGSGKKSIVKLFLRWLFGENLQEMNVKYVITGYGITNFDVNLPKSLHHI